MNINAKKSSLKKFLYPTCSWFSLNMFKSMVVSFVDLTNHLTKIRIKLYTFCISSVQSQPATSKQLSTNRCPSVIVLLCTDETERVQNLLRTPAVANFKSM